jgi:hypothetical protein
MEEKAVAIAELVLDIGCQPRAGLDSEAVEDYRQIYEADGKLPPVDAILVDGNLVVIDGFHRVAGAAKADHSFIRVKVVEEADLGRARWLAAAANQGHGVRRTNADKRAAVKLALQSDIGQEQTLRVIAEHVGVHHSTVADIKAGLSDSDTPEEDDPQEVDSAPSEPDDRPPPDMYVTAARVLKKAYDKVCKVLDHEDDVCEAAYRAYEMAKEREL